MAKIEPRWTIVVVVLAFIIVGLLLLRLASVETRRPPMGIGLNSHISTYPVRFAFGNGPGGTWAPGTINNGSAGNTRKPLLSVQSSRRIRSLALLKA
jgi:hypothetical protein